VAEKKIGAKIALDGEKAFKQAITGINQDLKVLGSEMGKVTAQFGNNAKSVEALTAKQGVYNKQIDEQKKKVESLRAALENSSKEYGENDKKTKEWQASLNKAEADLANLENALAKNNKELEKASSGMEQFKIKAEKMGESLKKIGDKVGDVGKKMSMAITAPIVGAGAASFKFAADLQDAMGAAEQIFKGASGDVKKWADGLDSAYGIAESDALSYANTMGAMLQNIGGLSEEEAAKQSETLVQLAGDLTAMFGGTTESAVQALTGALKGNNAMLDNYGMGVNDATIKAKALEMGLSDGTGALTLQAKQAATLALIMEQTADAQGQAAREADGASGSMRSLQTELKNIATDIGEILLPIITPLVASIKEMVQRFAVLSPEAQKTIVVIAGIAAAIGPLLVVAHGIISTIVTITSILPALGTAFTALTGPIGLAVAAIAGAIAIGVALYKNWDTIKAKGGELLNGITATFNSIKNAVTEKINAAKEAVRLAIEKIKGFFNFTWSLPKIKMPHFKIDGKFSLNPPQVPKLGVDWYKTGAVFDEPSVIGVGEAGPEAVIPLSKLSAILADSVKKVTNNNGGVYVNVNTPVYLDGKIITASTSRHQYGRNKTYSRAVGVTV